MCLFLSFPNDELSIGSFDLETHVLQIRDYLLCYFCLLFLLDFLLAMFGPFGVMKKHFFFVLCFLFFLSFFGGVGLLHKVNFICSKSGDRGITSKAVTLQARTNGFLWFRNEHWNTRALSLHVEVGQRWYMCLKETCLYIHCVLCKWGLWSSLGRDFSILIRWR